MNTSEAVVTGGFDDVRSREIRFLEEAAKFGRLTVALWSDEIIRRTLGKAPKFPEAERLYFLRAIRYVHDVKCVTEGIYENVLPKAPAGQTKVWVAQASQESAAKKAFCESLGWQYRILREESFAGFPEPAGKPPSGRRKKVIVTGCYDWFHSGHVRFFEEASAHGDLYVVLGHDANVRLLKGEGRPLLPQAERRYVVGSIRFVKQALISTGHGWLDAEPEIKRLKPDIYLVNEDGDVPEKRAYCEQHGIEYLVLKRTPAPGLPKRSSTELRGY